MTEVPKLIIFNSLSHKKEKFTSKGDTVGVYVCGVTPYDITHLGHAATYIFFDVAIRFLEYMGNKAKYIQNITDVDDDLLKKAAELNINWRLLAEKNFSLFLKDLNWLNIRMPDFFPRATDHIKEIISLNMNLEDRGFAYERNGYLYFDISKLNSYGKLSRLSKTEMLPISKERGNNPDDPNKKNPLDFVLWQPYLSGEPSWSSPWSLGRPGWHIECSAMSMKYLGSTFDIHGGGADLIYPHHESEIAQSESVTKKRIARFFMHTSMLFYKGQKMSKSLGNMVFIKDLKEKYSANSVRIVILKNHYQKSWEFNYSRLEEAQKINDLFRTVWLSESGLGNELDYSKEEKEFINAMTDDFNTRQALKSLMALSEKILKSKNESTTAAKAFLNQSLNILGLRIEF